MAYGGWRLETAAAGRPGTLYFTAGPEGESHGLFGAIDTAPEEPRHGRGHGQDHK